MTDTQNTNRGSEGRTPPDNSRLCLRQNGEQKTSREVELQSALRALGFRRAQVSYTTTAGIAMLIVDGQPYGRYDFARHTFVD